MESGYCGEFFVLNFFVYMGFFVLFFFECGSVLVVMHGYSMTVTVP